jgi:DNA ligase (NAD+)
VAPAAPPAAAERVARLREEIDRHNHAYYVLDDPVVDDAVYDGLMRELETLETQFPDLRTDDSPTARVGAPPQQAFKTVAHRVPMLSLGNAFSAEEIRAFDKRIREAQARHADGQEDGELEYCASPSSTAWPPPCATRRGGWSSARLAATAAPEKTSP